jgi:NADPH:quinone reductase-like Zn-dependent oxidoreductase
VAIEAAGVTHSDLLSRRGLYPGQKLPVTPGNDFVGRVEALGEGVLGLSIGQRVAGTSLGGCYATRRNIAALGVVPAPETADPAQLVAATLNGVCAYQMLHRLANVERDEWVLVHGAAGGLGNILVDLAILAGAKVIGTASAEKNAAVTSRGAVHVDYEKENVVERVLAISNGGVVAAFDHIGGKHLKKVSMPSLRPGGLSIVYGSYEATRDGKVHPLAMMDALFNSSLSIFGLFQKSQGAIGYILTPWPTHRLNAFRQDLAKVLSLVGNGSLLPLIGATFPLKKAAEAHRVMEAHSVSGKIVLVT